MTEAFTMMRIAFSALSTGHMPSLLQTKTEQAFGLEIITVMPNNSFRNLPRCLFHIKLIPLSPFEQILGIHSYSGQRQPNRSSLLSSSVSYDNPGACLSLFLFLCSVLMAK